MRDQEITTYLDALGAELAQRGFTSPIGILVVGGTYMVLKIGNRPSTEDIDILFLTDQLDMTRLPLSQQEKAFRAAIKAVAMTLYA